MQISLFGNLRITVAGKPVTSVNTNRLQSLIACLILHGETPQPRERLAFTLWPGSRESQARTNLRQLLHTLKHTLPAECDSLVIDRFAVQWRHDSGCAVDVLDFRAALANAYVARTERDCAREIGFLGNAAQLYQDDLLPALYDEWLLPLRDEYRSRMCDALHRLATVLEGQEDYPAAISWAARLVLLDPLNEASHQSLIRLHAANRDRASALRAYHQCMRVLRREMGVEPGPATRELFERILKGGPAATPGSPLSSTAIPLFDRIYPSGLQWYWKADFFRELSNAAIEKHLAHGSLLPTWQSTMHLYPVNGRVNRVAQADTAFGYHDVVWSEVIVGVDPDPANCGAITNWARAYYDALHPFSAGGAYLNFMMDEGEDQIRAAYRWQLPSAGSDQSEVRPCKLLLRQSKHPARGLASLA